MTFGYITHRKNSNTNYKLFPCMLNNFFATVSFLDVKLFFFKKKIKSHYFTNKH